jgi:hypothetical protein
MVTSAMRTSARIVGLFVFTLGSALAHEAEAAKGKADDSDASASADESRGSEESTDSDESASPRKSKPKKAKRKHAEEENAEPGEGDRSFSHAGQFGIRAALVAGYRMIMRYEPSPFCTLPNFSKEPKNQQKFCGHWGPAALDLAFSYTLIGSVEPFLWGRFGFVGEGKTDTQPLILVGAGARLYTMSKSAFKFFIEPAVGLELERGAGSPIFRYGGFRPDYRSDIILHLAFGPQIDLARGVGLYAHAALTMGILRYLQGTLELVGGVQVRFP